METVNIHHAKTHLSKLLARVSQGEEFVIAKAGKPIAKVVPVADDEPAPKKRRIGFMKGKIVVPDDFDTLYQDEIERMFYGES